MWRRGGFLLLIFALGFAGGVLAHRSGAGGVIRSTFAGVAATAVTAPTNQHYLHRTSMFREFPATADIVMAGDSITEMGDWPSIFPGVSIANRGIGWDNTAGLLARLDTINSTGAETAFVMIGTNDFIASTDVAATAARYERILAGLDAPRIVVQSTLFVGERLQQRNPLIAELNSRIAASCAADPRCSFVDLNSRLSLDGRLADRFSVDGVHLNGDGYRQWAQVIRPLME